MNGPGGLGIGDPEALGGQENPGGLKSVLKVGKFPEVFGRLESSVGTDCTEGREGPEVR